MKLSVVIPAYNEENRLGPTLKEVSRHLKRRRVSHEILVVDDGSSDSTVSLVEKAARKNRALKLVRQDRNRGKGAAVARGAMEAKGDVVLFTDADLSTPIEELDRLMPLVLKGTDVVVGSRALATSDITRRQPFYRHFGGKLFNLAVRLVALGGFSDTQCGFKMFKNRVGKQLFSLQQIPGFGVDVEFLYLARKFGYSCAEIPVRWANDPETKVTLASAAMTFFDLVKIRLNDLRGLYRRR